MRLHEFAVTQLIKANNNIKKKGFRKDFRKRIRDHYKKNWAVQTEEELKEYWDDHYTMNEEYGDDEFKGGWKEDADLAFDELMGRFTRVPDAYRICEWCKTIFMYEVEDSHKITTDKMAAYADFWFQLDSDYWRLVVYSVDRYGNIQANINLMDYWYALLEENVKHRKEVTNDNRPNN
ncbi:MAG: hypothetical protein CME31_20315 [Gimesia sp.]|nr:hypothetical protein [Gimesia sp.]|tara:strand:- start:3 stop:536 length:534 start_codon:yes stop_codon:yes gene_type:complete